MRRPLLALASLLVVLARPALAQSVRGEIVLPDSTTRAVGVIVVVTDGGGAVVSRTLAGDRGEFDVTLPRAGRYALRVLRIGYRPTLVPPFDVATAEQKALRVVLGGDVVSLAQVTVRGESVCRIREDSGQLVARLWEEARKAITATQLSAAAARLNTTWFRYDRVMDSTARIVRKQDVAVSSARTSRPFISEPPESLARFGYVVDRGGDAVYLAPDAEALLSDSFAATHCFRVEPPTPEHLASIGVGFRPAKDRDGIRDIEGTFWLDRATAELRLLEFRYTNMTPAHTAAGAGGRVDFLRLPTGHWLVSRWHIRMPAIAVRPAVALRGNIRSEASYVATAIHFAGGEVTEVRRDGVLLHSGGGATFIAQVVSRDSTIAAAGTIVDFNGTGYAAIADTAGRVRIEHVLPGRYTVRFSAAPVRRAGAAPAERTIDVREGSRAAPDTLELPASDAILSSACGEAMAKAKGALLYGTVRGSQREPVPGATVTVKWIARVDAAPGSLTVSDQSRVVATDDLGRWRLCGVPRDRALDVRAVLEGRASGEIRTRIPASRAIHEVELSLPAAERP